MTKPVLVAYDGSPESDRALEWGAQAAQSRQIPLVLVSAWTLPPSEVGIAAGPAYETKLLESLRQESQTALDKGVARAKELSPDVTATSELTAGPAAAVIVERAQDAAMVVLGSHGRTGISGMLLGSVSRVVATHVECPAIVVREPMDADSNTLVVGVDGSPSSINALEFAFGEASRRGYDLKVLHAWDLPPIGGFSSAVVFSPPHLIEDLTTAELRAVSAELAGHRERYPDVKVTTELLQAAPTKALQDASEHAAMVVVGSRGRGGFKGLLLGSVGHTVVHKSKCTTAIVR